MAEQNQSGNAVMAFLLGGAVGIIAGLLLAPKSGQETRRRLQDWIDDLGDKSQDILEEGKEILEQGKEVLQEKIDKVKRAADAGRKAYRENNEG
jgi:gas vesicle protein